MGLIDSILADASLPVLRRGAATLVRQLDLDDALTLIEISGARILGMEGFRVDGDSVIPDMESILDLSEVADAAESIAEARMFASHVVARDLWFEFVLAEF